MRDASESFLVRFDLGTSLETTEDLIMEFEEFKARAKVRSPAALSVYLSHNSTPGVN